MALTKELIRIPSDFGNEKDIGQFIASVLEGEDVILQKVPGYPPNVVAKRIVNRKAPTIILNGHMDTIRPLESWSHNPYKPRIKGNMLYGLGASDMKGGLAVMINSFLNCSSRNVNLILTATVDEEGFCTGAYAFARKYKGDFCIVGEPSGEKVVLGARGRFALDIELTGRASHGAKPHLGTNPIGDMGRVIESLGKVRTRKHSVLGKGSIVPLEIWGGVGSLTTPETCTLMVDRHIVPGETRKIIKRDFEQVMKGLEIESKVSISFVKRNTPFLEPYLTSKEDRFVRRFLEFFESEYRREPLIDYAMSVGDYNVFGSQMPTVVYGPIGRESHSSRERLDVRSLYRCERFLTNFLRSF